MKVEKLVVQNYRTLQDITIDFVGYYTAISGRNNAGKTTLVRVLREMFKDHFRERFYFGRDERSYGEDKTQWASGDPDIVFDYYISIEKESEVPQFKRTPQ